MPPFIRCAGWPAAPAPAERRVALVGGPHIPEDWRLRDIEFDQPVQILHGKPGSIRQVRSTAEPAKHLLYKMAQGKNPVGKFLAKHR